ATGSFAGLAEGAAVSVVGSSAPAYVTYAGGSGASSGLNVDLNTVPQPGAPAVRRFDFNAAGSPTAAAPAGGLSEGVRASDQVGVAGSDHGWTTTPSEYDTALSPAAGAALFRDFHWGSGLATFQVTADPAKTYTVRLYLGDARGLAWNGIQVRAYDSAAAAPA